MVTATSADFARPVSGPFAAADYFLAQDIAARPRARRRWPWAASCPASTATRSSRPTFTAVGAVEGGDDQLRHHREQRARSATTRTRPSPAWCPTPEILVDVDSAGGAGVLVTDTTLPSHGLDPRRPRPPGERPRSSRAPSPPCLRPRRLRRPGAPAGRRHRGRQLYTWTLAAAPAARATARSPPRSPAPTAGPGGQRQPATITADNTAPAMLGGLVASPGHEQVHLSWDDPAADGGSPLAGRGLPLRGLGRLPRTTPAPCPTARPTSAGGGEVTGLGHGRRRRSTGPSLPRDVYAVAGFVVDLVGNVSPLGDSGAATNYWLGDTDGDGYVTVVPDINALGDTYGLTDQRRLVTTASATWAPRSASQPPRHSQPADRRLPGAVRGPRALRHEPRRGQPAARASVPGLPELRAGTGSTPPPGSSPWPSPAPA